MLFAMNKIYKNIINRRIKVEYWIKKQMKVEYI